MNCSFYARDFPKDAEPAQIREALNDTGSPLFVGLPAMRGMATVPKQARIEPSLECVLLGRVPLR